MRVLHLRRCLGRSQGGIRSRWNTNPGRHFLARAHSSTGSSPPPPAASTSSSSSASPPPPASGTPSVSDDPPPPASGAPSPAASPSTSQAGPSGKLQCGGFFFTCDPNIGLWHDRVNPNWRLTFTDSETSEKQRIPYAIAIQHRGPHFELAVRLQSGFVSCDDTFDAVPEKFAVESGWEVTLPLFLSGVRLCHTIIRPDGEAENHARAAVYCVDLPIGLCAGFHRAAYGVALKGSPEPDWRGQVAMVTFVAFVLAAIYNVVTLPRSWMELIEEISKEDDPDQMIFEALDIDGDGYITLADVQEFVRQAGLDIDASALFQELDTLGSGRVSFEQFQESLEALLDAQERLGGLAQGFPQQSQRTADLKPFGGAFTPGLVQPFGGAFNPNLVPPDLRQQPRVKGPWEP